MKQTFLLCIFTMLICSCSINTPIASASIGEPDVVTVQNVPAVTTGTMTPIVY